MNFLRLAKSKRGEQMVEASVVMPVVILTVALMLRFFSFSLEILSVQAESHMAAAESWSSYDKPFIWLYKDQQTVYLAENGLLKNAVKKDVITEAYLLNEDVITRTGEILFEE